MLRAAERRLGLAEALAGCIRELRDPARTVHTLPALLRFRMFASACGYEDADDCNDLRADPLFKLAVGRAPECGRDLCSQPTMSHLENAPSCSEVGRLTGALVDIFCGSFDAPPAAITLDIDETYDPVHGHQQLSLFHGCYDMRCFLPVHVYHVESGKPVAVLLRPGKTPSGVEVPRRRRLPPVGGPVRDLRTLTAGAACPTNPSPFSPQHQVQNVKSRHRQGAEHKPLRAQNPTDLIDMA